MILRSCNFNSEVDAELIAWAPEPAVAWRHWRVRDHVIVHYRSARTFETHSGLVRVRTILLPLPPGELPGQPITRAGSESTAIAYTKCDGAALFDLVCDPELRSELFAEVGVGCAEHESWRREPGRD